MKVFARANDVLALSAAKASLAEDKIRPIMHPNWSTAHDYHLLLSRANGKDFCYIAGELERNTTNVKLRYHRLRQIEGIQDALLDFGLTEYTYDID